MKKPILLLALALSFNAFAASESIHVKPTTLVLGPNQESAALTVTNESDTPLRSQVRVFAWDQKNGKDDLQPTQEIAASPPMATLAPHASQQVRIVRLSKSAPASEKSYRILVDDLPDASLAPKVGVEIQLRYSIPVFVTSASASPPNMTVVAKVSGDTISLMAQNKGGSHVQATNITVEYADGVSTPVTKGLAGYVLAGKSMQWTLAIPPNAAAKGVPKRVHVQFNGKDMAVAI